MPGEAFKQRSAQRTLRQVASAMTSGSLGSATTWSNAITKSLPSVSWIAIERSGVNLQCRPIDVGAKRDAIFGHFGALGQAEDLKSAAVGQDRPRPPHELVQAAESGDRLFAGAQSQMVGVGQHDLGTRLAQADRCRPP